jgi:hypothetical protein
VPPQQQAPVAPAVPAPPKPIPPPPTITPDAKIKQRPPSHEIKNPFERTASMIVEAAEDYAKRLAANLSEQAADTVEADPHVVNEMMQFSPFGTDAPRAFWATHDRLLQEAANNGDPDPYAVAERGALDEVYPYRARLALLDVLDPEDRVKRAEELMRVIDRQIARGDVPEAMPTITGPAGLPAQADEEESSSPRAAGPPPQEGSSANGTTNGRY